MKIKILVFMQSLGGGGAERTVINVINNLNKNNFFVTLVVGDNSKNVYKEYLNEGTNIIDLKTTRLRYSFLRLRNTIIKEQPDIIFTTVVHNNIMASLVKMSILKQKPKLIVREAANRSETKAATKINKVITNFCYNYIADEVIALSKGVKTDLITNFGIKKNRIKVIYNPIDLKAIERLKKEEIIEDSFSKNEKILISVGRLVEVKDYPTLLRAFKIVSEKHKAKLIIAGVGHLEKKLKKLASDLNIYNDVLFKGFVQNPYKYMSRSDVFVLTSKHEGFGHVIVEAMASCVPVISTNCNSGPKEIITHNLNGKLVEIGNYEELAHAILETLASDNKVNVLNGKKRAKDFDAKTIVQDYELLFNRIKNN